jgi:Mce-associated membrane protein
VKTEKQPDTAENLDAADESEATADDGVVEENSDTVEGSVDAAQDESSSETAVTNGAKPRSRRRVVHADADQDESGSETAVTNGAKPRARRRVVRADADQDESGSATAVTNGAKPRARRVARTDADQDESGSATAVTEADQDESSSEPAKEDEGGKRRWRRRLRTGADQDGSSSEPAEEDEGVKRRWRRLLRVAGVYLLFLAPVGISAFLGWQLWQQHQTARAGEDARRAAVSYAQILTSLDPNKVDENFAQVLDGSTGKFKDMYSKSSVQLRQLLIDNKASSRGVVQEWAIQSQAKNKVVVLLFVDQSVSNLKMPDPRIDRSRIKMTMEYVDGRWRASEIELS